MTVKTEGGAPARSAARASGGGSVRAGTVERLGSLEVRWIFPGRMTAEVTRWFGRFPGGVESREDTYLLDPLLPGLSVKVRGAGCWR
jgi:hypothetical protein